MSSTLSHLSNGLPVLTVPMSGVESACVHVLVRVGSRLETKAEQGLSHFLEHMVFKGTDKRPTARELTQILDGVGAEFNAYTTKEYTGYYVKSAADHLPLALDVVSDMLWHSRFEADELEREKKVIVEEINMYEDNPLMHIGDLLENAVFKGSGLGQLISGSRESVRALKHTQLIKFWREYYHPKNMLLVVAGKITPQAKVSIQKTFGERRASGLLGKFTPFIPRIAKPQVALHYKDTEQVQLALAFPSYGWKHKNLLTLDLLSTILGGSMSSRLFVRLREKEGLCYSVRSGVDCYQGTGLLAVQAGLDKSRLSLAIKLIREELSFIVKNQVDDGELLRAKEYTKGRMTLALEDCATRAEWVGKRWWLEQSRVTPQEQIKKLQTITARQIQAVAREVIVNKSATIALIGPFKNKSQWLKLLY